MKIMYAIVNGKKYTGIKALEKFSEALKNLKKKYPHTRDVRDTMNPYTEGIITENVYKEILKFKEEGYFGFTLGHIPFSSQSKSKKRKIVNKIVKARIKNRRLDRLYNSFQDKELSVKITFFLGSKYSSSDLDNFAKEIIDLIKGIVFPDDKQIKVLTLKKEFVPKLKYRTLQEQVGVKIY